jgi:hypothetical protein
MALGDAWASRYFASGSRAESTESTESFQPHFLGEEANSENDYDGNYIRSRGPALKTFRTFRTFRSARPTHKAAQVAQAGPALPPRWLLWQHCASG